MAVRKPFMLKRVLSGNLELEAIEESFRIHDIAVANPATWKDAFTIQIKETTMNVLPAYLLGFRPFHGIFKGLFDYVQEVLPDIPKYGVVNGEVFKIIPESTYGALEVRYQVNDPGDIGLGDPGTRTSTVRFFAPTAYFSSNITSTGWHSPDTVLGLPEAPRYPFIARVPADKVLEIVGIAVYAEKAGSTKPVYLRIWDGETVLFDEDRYGFLIDPDIANSLESAITISGLNSTHAAVNFFRFPEPWVLNPQTELTFEVYVEYDGTNALPSKAVMITLLGRERPA